jgi:O-antigen ligase
MTRRKNNVKPISPPDSPAAPPAAAPADRLRPWLLGGAMALVVARPLYPSESAAFYGDGLPIVMLWIVLAVFWLLGAIGRPRFSLRFGWPDAALLFLLAWHTAAAVWAAQHGTPRPAINMLWEWIGLGLCFLLTRQLLATAREARAMVAVMVGLTVAVAGYGLYQRAYELPQTRKQYQADPDRALRDAGWWFPPGSPERELFESRLWNREPLATFALTNSLAAFLAPWLVMLTGIGLTATRRSRKRLLGVLGCLLLIAACLLLTKSRSGLIAAGVGLLLVWLLGRKRAGPWRWKTPSVLLAAAVVLVAAVAGGVFHRELLGRATTSFGYRLQYWQSSLQMIADHPLMGCGPGNFQNAYLRYKLPEASEEVADPHDFLLEIWATAGTPAALAFLAVLAAFAWAAYRQSRDSDPSAAAPDGWRHVLAGGVIGFLLSLPLGMLSESRLGITAVLLGLPLAVTTTLCLGPWVERGCLPRFLPAVGVVVLLVDLLASGGIGFPGVAGTLWLLLALGLQGEPPRALHPAGAWGALLVALVLTLACYATAYSPVLECQAQLRRAEREPAKAVEHIEAAATADPLAVEPWRQLAAIAFENWRQQPSADAFHRFEGAVAKILELAPNSAPAWLAAGDWYFRASSKLSPGVGRSAAQAVAAADYRRAAHLYPNSPLGQAKLAGACRAAGDSTGFREAAAAALRLDSATPHLDKKLPDAVRDRLLRALGRAR